MNSGAKAGESPRGGGSRERSLSISQEEKSRLQPEERRVASKGEKAFEVSMESKSFPLLYFKSICSTDMIC